MAMALSYLHVLSILDLQYEILKPGVFLLPDMWFLTNHCPVPAATPRTASRTWTAAEAPKFDDT